MAQVATFNGTADESTPLPDLANDFVTFTSPLSMADFRSWTNEGGNVVARTEVGFTLTLEGVSLSQLGNQNFVGGGQHLFAGPAGLTAALAGGGLLVGSSVTDDLEISGGDGFIQGGAGQDILEVSDTLANPYQFFVNGNEGVDTIIADVFGTGTLRGGEGNDFLGNFINDIDVGVNGNYEIYGDAGADTIWAEVEGTARIFGDSPGANGVGDGDDYINVEIGDAGDVLVRGNQGKDTIEAEIDGEGNGVFTGGAGEDDIDVDVNDQATALIHGDRDGDTIMVDIESGASARVFGGNGSGNQSADGDDSITLDGFGMAFVNGQAGNDFIDVTGISGSERYYGDAMVRGGADNDTILVGGDDLASTGQVVTVLGDDGNDTIDLEAGESDQQYILRGNEGMDTINVDLDGDGSNIFGASVAVFGGLDDDTINLDQFDDIGFGILTGATVDVSGGGGNDLIQTTGGNYSADFQTDLNIEGGQGDDTVDIDDFEGGTIDGGEGDDILYGREGNDITGGADADEFRFTAWSDDNIIRDFTPGGEDTIAFLDAVGGGGSNFTNSNPNGPLGSNDFLTFGSVATYNATAGNGTPNGADFVAMITSGLTNGQINGLDNTVAGDHDFFVAVFNTDESVAEIYYDEEGATGLDLIATLDDVTTLAEFQTISVDDFGVFA